MFYTPDDHIVVVDPETEKVCFKYLQVQYLLNFFFVFVLSVSGFFNVLILLNLH